MSSFPTFTPDTYRGCADTLLEALAKRKHEVTDLTGVSNNAGGGNSGLGQCNAFLDSDECKPQNRQIAEHQST